ncbi:MAG: C40 family peptidase [Actinomycetaceae bacterium]|nr:C40 family peptidase [Actinomycetaceae bacterium]
MAKKIQARHRRACRPVTPLSDISETLSPVRSVATISATGIALSVIGSGVATAAPSSALDLAPKAPATINEGRVTQANPVVTAPSDVEWASDDVVSVEVEIVEVVEEVLEDRVEVADRDYERGAYEEAPQPVLSIPAASTSAAVGIAAQYIGVPYVWAGASPSGFDCSGLVSYVYAQLGYNLPHSSYGIGASGTSIPASEAAPGDIVYYGGHVGIYAGDGMMIHSPEPGRGVEYAAVYGYPTYVRL